jgi:hypothetical protein
MKAVKLKHLYMIESEPEYANSKVISIDEGQFFPDLYTTVSRLVSKTDKTFIISGLDGNSDQQKFGGILDLIPIADSVIKLCAICQECNDGTLAPFTICNVKKSSEVLIGDEVYSSVCRKHLSATPKRSYPHTIQLPENNLVELDSKAIQAANPLHYVVDIIRLDNIRGDFKHFMGRFKQLEDIYQKLDELQIKIVRETGVYYDSSMIYRYCDDVYQYTVKIKF